MKSKELCSVLLGVAVAAGCGSKPPDAAKAEEPIVFGPQFSPSKGLSVPPDTRQSLDLKVVEVTEQEVGASLEMQLRIYEAGEAFCRATGTVTPEEGKLLKKGQMVDVRSRDGKTATGAVAAVSDRWQKATGSMEVLVEIPEAPDGFAVGGFLHAKVAMGANQKVVTIPRAALLECIDGHSVYTVSGEHFVRTPVKAGRVNAELAEIKDGLYAGDQVVLQPVMSLWMTELAAVKGGASVLR